MTYYRLLPALLTVGLFGAARLNAGEPLRHVTAWADLDGTVQVRWVTEAPSKGDVQWGHAVGALNRRVPEDEGCLRGTTNNSDSGQGWANNHRADFANDGTWPVTCRIVAATREGGAVQSEILTVREPLQPTSQVERQALSLTVDPGDWPLATMPLTFGVPFPRGALASDAHVRIMAGTQPLPTQTKVVSRWHPDQSVKWLRVDAVAPREVKALVLEFGTQVRRPARWEPMDPKPGEALPPHFLSLTDREGKLYAFAPGEPVAEEEGETKVVLRYEGPMRNDAGDTLFRCVVRVHWWRGVGSVRRDVTLENTRTDEEMTSIRAFQAAFPTPVRRVEAGAGKETVLLRPGERILQREDSEWVREPAGAGGKRLDGVFRLEGERTVVLRNFWQQWPAAVSLREDQLVLGLCPRLPDALYAGREDEDKYYYQVRDGLHTFRQGWSKTWEIWETDGQSGSGLNGEYPVVSLPPEWVEDSGALRRLAVSVRDTFPGYDDTLAANIEAFPAERDRRREYGMMNFGDWYGERRWNWGNLEYDLGHGFLTQYARTGYAPFRRRADEIIRHQRDVDTRHYAGDPRRIGQQWIHSIGHTAGYYDDAYKNMKSYAGRGWSDNRGHIWSQGMFEHYLFGGDTRSWETALLISDWAAGPQTTNFRFGNAREPGWMTKLVMSAYAASEDPFYLNAARIMLEATHERSLASGSHGFYCHTLPKGHCNCPDGEKHSGEAGFMLGVLMTGMKMVYDVTGDPVIADDIAGTARFIVDTMWEPADGAFRYTSCPKTGATAGSAWIMMEGLAFGARHSGDMGLADVCREALVHAWQALPTSGKSAGYVLCNAAQALEEVARLPGISFREYREKQERVLSSPARRGLPTLVPNPDIEETEKGWPSRGWAVERSTEAFHSGAASLHISGQVAGQNEYVNTTYDSSGSPWEITWLEPGAVYRLTAWVRVDRISEGVPAPSLRLAFRDGGGTRGSAGTSAYDLSRLGTWQQLSGAATVPEWNTSNYIALNTNSRDAIDIDMFLDDVHLTPEKAALPEHPRILRLEAAAARLEGQAQRAVVPAFHGQEAVSGPGAAAWTLGPDAAGTYTLWLRLDAGARIDRMLLAGTVIAGDVSAEEPDWVYVGKGTVPAGGGALELLGLAEGTRVGRVVLTDVP